ncbi:hypothetical protein ES703_86568 [subsurface metagenome]
MMNVDRLTYLIAYSEHGVQRGHGVLKDYGDMVTPDVLHLFAALF